MKPFNPIQQQIITFLNQGGCHSGETLGKALSLSRTAIWKHIHQLIELGVPIQKIPQRGYQLQVPVHLLNTQTIHTLLNDLHFNQPYQFHHFFEINSTNQFLKDLIIETPSSAAPPLHFCCTETQTAGRGRFGRQWNSPFGENIYFSGRWRWHGGMSQLSGLSLVVGLAILDSLTPLHLEQNILIKWPNDLLWKNQKLCGILIELSGESHGALDVVIGIGLNVNTHARQHQLSENPWCSLFEITGRQFDRNTLVANLIISLSKYLTQFLDSGFAPFKPAWEQVDYLKDQWINISQPTKQFSGYACGVNEQGLLCVKDGDEQLHYVSAGETSLRALK